MGTLETLQRIATGALAQLGTRLALLRIELEYEKLRLGGILLVGACVLFFSAFAVAFGAFGVIAHYWDTPHRVSAILSIAAIFLLAALACGVVLFAKLHTRSTLFESSLLELSKDRHALEHPE